MGIITNEGSVGNSGTGKTVIGRRGIWIANREIVLEERGENGIVGIIVVVVVVVVVEGIDMLGTNRSIGNIAVVDLVIGWSESNVVVIGRDVVLEVIDGGISVVG